MVDERTTHATGELREQVVSTTDKAIQVLGHFERSLKAAGFVDGVSSYRDLTDILIQQYEWVGEVNDAELQSNFERLGMAASRIEAILAPYSSIMRSLAAMTEERPPASTGIPVATLEPKSARVLRAIEEHKRPITATRLRTKTGQSTRELRGILAQLENRGLISSRTASGRKLFFVQ